MEDVGVTEAGGCLTMVLEERVAMEGQEELPVPFAVTSLVWLR